MWRFYVVFKKGWTYRKILQNIKNITWISMLLCFSRKNEYSLWDWTAHLLRFSILTLYLNSWRFYNNVLLYSYVWIQQMRSITLAIISRFSNLTGLKLNKAHIFKICVRHNHNMVLASDRGEMHLLPIVWNHVRQRVTSFSICQKCTTRI